MTLWEPENGKNILENERIISIHKSSEKQNKNPPDIGKFGKLYYNHVTHILFDRLIMLHILFKCYFLFKVFLQVVKKHDIHIKPKSYKLELLGELVV